MTKEERLRNEEREKTLQCPEGKGFAMARGRKPRNDEREKTSQRWVGKGHAMTRRETLCNDLPQLVIASEAKQSRGLEGGEGLLSGVVRVSFCAMLNRACHDKLTNLP